VKEIFCFEINLTTYILQPYNWRNTMLPGPTIIMKCSTCSEYIEQSRIISGNTFGAKIWTDGWRDAPMMPDQPSLVKCPHCGSLLWIDELEKLGETEQWSGGSEFKGSKPYHVPDSEAYMRLLKERTHNPEKEIYLRLRAWWAGNDARRETDQKMPLSEEEIGNLQAVSDLLDEQDPNDRLMKAEIMRELGRFDEAKRLLDHPFDDEYVQAFEIISDLVAQKNPFVAEMRFD